MAATIVRFDRARDTRDRDQRLLELVRDLTGAPSGAVAAAFEHAPAEPLERVAHALVQLRHRGSLRIAAYVPEVQPPAGRAADIVPIRSLHAGPTWPARLRDQLIRARSSSSTER